MKAKAVAYIGLKVDGKIVKRVAVHSLDETHVRSVVKSARLTRKEWQELGRPDSFTIVYSVIEAARRVELQTVERLIPKLSVPGESVVMVEELKARARELRRALGMPQVAEVAA